MKLKKIASLALAGIMAVSMLAGCGEAASSSEPTNPVNPVTSDVADAVNKLLSGDQKEVMTFGTSSALLNAVKAVAGDSGVVTPTMIANAYDTNETSFGSQDSYQENVTKKVKDKFTTGVITVGDAGWNAFKDTDPTNQEKSSSCLYVYVVSGDMSEDTIARNFLATWGSSIDDTILKSKTADNNDIAYDGDIAAVKVYNSKDATKTAWVVGVMLTETVTNGTNTQV